MSSIYVTEPPTKGKLILKTSLGPLEVELWPKEAPLACRNFVQLCLEGYFDNTIFHRVLKDFILQGGDPTGTGEGGDSIYEGPFKDEFHSRLRFRHRGMLAMANDGPNTNRSQFFITLNTADHLNGKNTIFGKIVGDSIFNALKVNDFELDEDRPVYPIKLISVDIVYNPFDDITPRPKVKPREPELAEKGLPIKPKRNLTLLSFGEEEDQEEENNNQSKTKKIKSIHSVQAPPATAENVRNALSKPPSKETKKDSEDKEEPEADLDEADFERAMRQKVRESLTTQEEKPLTSLSEKQSSEREELARKMKELKKELRKMKKDKEKVETETQIPEREKTEEEKERERQEEQKRAAKEFLQKQKEKYATNKPHSKKEKQQKALEKFLQFTKTLRQSEPQEEDDGKESKASEQGWFNHRLVFEKDKEKQKNEDDYSTYDPLKHGKKEDQGPQLSYHQKRLQRKPHQPGKW